MYAKLCSSHTGLENALRYGGRGFPRAPASSLKATTSFYIVPLACASGRKGRGRLGPFLERSRGPLR
eukprot:2486568-Pyramimonas_sp.AAC.1